MHAQSLLHSTVLLISSGLLMFLSIQIRNYLEKHPGKSRPANGKTPPFLGLGNGIGIKMCGDFERENNVNAQYAFIFVLIPIIPIGCYYSSAIAYSNKSHKHQTTTYSIGGTQPWRFLEIVQIYFWWISFWGLAIGVIGFIASLFGANFI